MPANLANLYRDKVVTLTESLSHPETVLESAEALRGLIDRVIVLWDTDHKRHSIELEGRLAALLRAAEPTNTESATSRGAVALDERSLKRLRGQDLNL
ncbi:hypothetical protein [Acetobacter aceti]|uniref:hypothetical protein n=1 Tax=Acetobacter aceti TaxID=435 RepID=UPI0016259BB5|nr:hypothetical protein [Acetobacter aceti]